MLVKRKKRMGNNFTSEAVEKQARAMGAAAFEIGLFDPRATRATMLTREWDLDTLLKSVRWLRLKNAEGRHIYIRPAGEHSLSLIDDLTAQVIERLKVERFSPAVVLETSPGNFQTWLNHGHVLSREASTCAARRLAVRFGGDPGSADWRHYGRLAGFTNRKDKYRRPDGTFPYVLLHEANGAVYANAAVFLEELEAIRQTQSSGSRPEKWKTEGTCCSGAKSIEDFRKRPIYAGDQTRVDLAYAIYALSHGVSENDARIAIASRDLAHKGNQRRQRQYVDRTIAKAWRLVRAKTACLSSGR
jgi:RepB DNA-primase from phage plasmid